MSWVSWMRIALWGATFALIALALLGFSGIQTGIGVSELLFGLSLILTFYFWSRTSSENNHERL